MDTIPLLGLLLWCAALSAADLRHRRLPNTLTLPGAGLVLGYAWLDGRWPIALAGALLLALPYALVHLAMPAALGAGDVKLALGLGGACALTGAPAWTWAAVGAPLLTALAGAGALLAQRLIPFGPPAHELFGHSWRISDRGAHRSHRSGLCEAAPMSGRHGDTSGRRYRHGGISALVADRTRALAGARTWVWAAVTTPLLTALAGAGVLSSGRRPPGGGGGITAVPGNGGRGARAWDSAADPVAHPRRTGGPPAGAARRALAGFSRIGSRAELPESGVPRPMSPAVAVPPATLAHGAAMCAASVAAIMLTR